MRRPLTATKQIMAYRQAHADNIEDEVAVECPLTITLDGNEFATIVCSPSHIEELTIGFLAAESVIRSRGDLRSLHIDESNGYAYVETHRRQTVTNDVLMKRFIGSCCGKSRHFYYESDVRTAKTVTSMHRISKADCFSYIQMLQEHSTAFKKTGGVHNAALCGQDGVLAVRTDIGRHNALDKLYGYCLGEALPLHDKLIAFSGRVSSEVLLKVAKIGVGLLLSTSAPTDLAIELAEELNVTIVGFIRENSFNVYTHPERIYDLATRPAAAVK